MISYSVIEGSHKNPNEIKTIDEKTKKVHGPFSKKKDAESLAKSLIQKNIDDFSGRSNFEISSFSSFSVYFEAYIVKMV